MTKLVQLIAALAIVGLNVGPAFGQEQQVILAPVDDALDSSGSSDLTKVQDELKKAEIIPTVIDDFLPTFHLSATWPSEVSASLGNTLAVDDVQDEPSISITTTTTTDTTTSHSSGNNNNKNTTYIITITDPDAPSRENPEWSEICHFIATGVSISSISSSSPSSPSPSFSPSTFPTFPISSSLKSIMPYKPPGPPPKTGKHRYVFLVFAPANGTAEPLDLTKPADRRHWGTGKEGHGVRDWAGENGLEPVAANFIYAQNEKQ
ncbi:PEBP-like protein [Xylariomycetidae sp. FL2044]|nr:PEBP-like protein [Xylariomycetidae sp. FL2044]